MLECRPDIVWLQEVTDRSSTTWIKTLDARGHYHIRATVGGSSERRRGPRAYGVLIASRYPLGNEAGVAFPVP